MLYTGRSDVTESMVTTRSPFCGYAYITETDTDTLVKICRSPAQFHNNSAFCDGTSRYGVPENLTTG